MLTTKVLGETFHSPIGLEAPIIPVRLPNALLPGKVSNEIYDLIEILNIQERDPKNRCRRCDPVTRNYFQLHEITPAASAVNKTGPIVGLKKHGI